MGSTFSLAGDNAATAPFDTIIVGVFEDKTLTPAAQEIDQASAGALARLLQSGDLSGKSGTAARVPAPAGISAMRVIVVGLGERAKLDPQRYAKACAEAARALCASPAERALNCLTEIEVTGTDTAWRTRQAALAVAQHQYRYSATVKPKPNGDKLVAVALRAAGEERALAQAEAIAAGTRLARDLANLPPNICNPAYLAGEARRLAAEETGVEVEVLDRAEMQRLGMGALLAVGQGSANPPQLIVLRYRGGGDAKPYALVGKGITFDTGGINLKVQGGIEEMKYDMCGAATVIGSFLAVVRLKLALNLVCVVPAVENMPDGQSYRPSDVLTTMAGHTVEVLNTDAEGRLILCDALTYTQRYEPQAMVDVATLTGACVIALGKHAHGLMSRHDDLAEQLLSAGQRALDRAWRLPLWDDYQQHLESSFADFANIGGKSAGAITAGCFLARFTESQRWAHLDIAGTAWDEGRKGMATGRPVPLLVQWLIERAGAS
jgi:leucyl aminopeptidase